jgi:hypothetical protein
VTYLELIALRDPLSAERVKAAVAEREHVCDLSSPWPVGHPLPVEDPAKLQGPELGFALYEDKHAGEIVVVKVIERSYVWSPGECRACGGYRHYDWSVIEEGPNKYRAVVVNDTDLSPIPAGQRVQTVYTLKGN